MKGRKKKPSCVVVGRMCVAFNWSEAVACPLNTRLDLRDHISLSSLIHSQSWCLGRTLGAAVRKQGDCRRSGLRREQGSTLQPAMFSWLAAGVSTDHLLWTRHRSALARVRGWPDYERHLLESVWCGRHCVLVNPCPTRRHQMVRRLLETTSLRIGSSQELQKR
jgi:hypothetical protein